MDPRGAAEPGIAVLVKVGAGVISCKFAHPFAGVEKADSSTLRLPTPLVKEDFTRQPAARTAAAQDCFSGVMSRWMADIGHDIW